MQKSFEDCHHNTVKKFCSREARTNGLTCSKIAERNVTGEEVAGRPSMSATEGDTAQVRVLILDNRGDYR
jgi:hypothetical protein